MTNPVFRTAYDGLQNLFSDLGATDFTVPDDHTDYHPSRSLTVQADADECDMNFIMARYVKTGLLPQSRAEGFFGDASALPDFQQAQQILIDANMAFESLPAKVRDRFHNSPEKFLAFMADEDNRQEAVLLGLLKPPQEAAPAPDGPHKAKEGEGAPEPSTAQE